MDRKYARELNGGKVAYKMVDGNGNRGREVESGKWDLDSYVNYCLFPISDCINRMRRKAKDETAMAEYADILDRLYDAALMQLEKMYDAIRRDMGRIQITTTNETCYGGFLHQDILEGQTEKELNGTAAGAAGR